MNEFDVPMSDVEMNMLPPGSNKPHERLIAESGLEMNWVGAVIAGAGMFLNYMGGRKQDKRYAEMADAQYEQDKITWEFEWEEAQDQYAYQLHDINVAEHNLEQQRIYRDATAINEWIDKDKQRIFDYNNQVDAYNAGVEAYETQLDVNEIAADMSENSARRAYNDKMIQMGFQLESTDINTLRAIEKLNVGRRQLEGQAKEAKRTSKNQRDILRANLDAKRRDISTKIEQQDLQGLEAVDKIRSYGQTGRSARKNRYRALQATSRLTEALQTAYDTAEERTELDLKGINIKLEALGDRLDLQDEDLVNDIYNTRVDQAFSEKQLSEQLKSTNLEYEFNQEKQKLDKYSMDIQAKSRLNPTPILAPQLSKPLKMPEPVLVKPRKPRKGPAPKKYIASSGHGLAALGSGMASFGSALAGMGGSGGGGS